MTNKNTEIVKSPKVEKKPPKPKQYFLRNDSDCQRIVDGVGVLPKGKMIPIPDKFLACLLADEAGLKTINISIVN